MTELTEPSRTGITRAEFTRADLTLRDAAGLFARHSNARVLVPATVGAIASRLALGRWTKRDAVAAGVIVGIEPFVEWLIHVHVLHRRPKTVDGQTVDSILARSHRAHHREPRDPELVFIPRPTLLPAIGALAAANLAGNRSLRAGLSGFAASMTALTAYEWSHFLIHSSYRPKTALYRALRRNHQLHHFRNENYWFGVMSPVSDMALNTHPQKEDVPASSTAKTLGIPV